MLLIMLFMILQCIGYFQYIDFVIYGHLLKGSLKQMHIQNVWFAPTYATLRRSFSISCFHGIQVSGQSTLLLVIFDYSFIISVYDR